MEYLKMSTATIEKPVDEIEKLVDEELDIDFVQTQEVFLESRWWLDQCREDKAGYVAKLTSRVVEEFEGIDADIKSATAGGFPALRWFCNGIDSNSGRSIPCARTTHRTLVDMAAFVLCGWEHGEMPERLFHLHQACWRVIRETESAIAKLESGQFDWR
jgi:hypothetical protein